MAVVVVIVTPVEEIKAVVLQLKEKNKHTREADDTVVTERQDAAAEWNNNLQEWNRLASRGADIVNKSTRYYVHGKDNNVSAKSNVLVLDRNSSNGGLRKNFDTEI